MGYLAIPFRIEKGGFARHGSVKEAIDETLRLIISTPLFSTPADPNLGFVFSNLRFEQIDEKEGVVCNPTNDEWSSLISGVYGKKISGNSRNFDTFAAELKDAILHIEKRLADIKVAMTYLPQERAIHVTVNGKIKETGEEYKYYTTISIWN